MAEPVTDAAERVRLEGQEIQAQIDRREGAKQKTANGKKQPMQAGMRDYPSTFPAQHLRKHAAEAELEFAPMCDAPYYKGSEKLKGLAALVTGGSSGIGRAVSILFAREGADVAIVHLSGEEDAEASRRAVEREGQRCELIRGDVGDAAFCREAVARTVAAFGRIDILVNNAAFQQHADDIEDITDRQFERTLRTNLFGYFAMARAAIPHMPPKSSIIMTGSAVGFRGSPELLDYSMTKGGIHAFTKALASNLVDKGIRVNAVAPGPVWTALNPSDRPADDVKTFGTFTPMGRAAQPEEIAPAFVFLASPAMGSYITGEILPVIGGYGS